MNITTLVVVSFLFLVPTAVILYIASHRVPIEETEIEDNKNKIVITPQQVFSRDPWSVACERLNKKDDDEKNAKNTNNNNNKSTSKSIFDDDEFDNEPSFYNNPHFSRPDGDPYVNYKLFGTPPIFTDNFHHHNDD